MKKQFRMVVLLGLLVAFQGLVAQKPALLIVDIQDFYFPGGRMELKGPEKAGKNAGKLLEHFRSRDLPVVFVRHNFEPGGSIHQSVLPRDGESVISKDQVNSFHETPLDELLRKMGVDSLVICGMQTHMCVEAAVRAGHDLGYHCTLVEDACATRDLEYEGHIIPAESVHKSTLKTLSGTYCIISKTNEYIK